MSGYRVLESTEDTGYLSWEEVLQEEKDSIAASRSERVADALGGEGVRFSLAFSGGGIRAAAFQAGVLWRLAEENRLKDVDYFTAVSGGGYITAAFASHCLGARDSPPRSPEEVRGWYLDVVAKTLCRMQRNAGDFVRDCFSAPGVPEDGSGCLPRVLDLPVLLCALGVTLVVLPFFFSVCILVPFAISMELFFGSALRAAFCAPASDQGWRYVAWQQTAILLRWSPYGLLLCTLLGAFLAYFLVLMLHKVLPCCRLRPPRLRNGKPMGRERATRCYLVGYATTSFLKRFFLALVLMASVPYYMAMSNSLRYEPAVAAHFCRQYIAERQSHDMSEDGRGCRGCADYYGDGRLPWWREAEFDRKAKDLEDEGSRQDAEDLASTEELIKSMKHGHDLLFLLKVLAGTACVGFCLAPIVGGELLQRVLFVAGPVMLFIFTVECAQFRIYGPLTRNAASTWLWNGFDFWDHVVHYALLACVFLFPFMGELRATFHHYYRRCLHCNYFHQGEDVPMQDLAGAGSPYCPFVLMTGTACDYKPPGEEDSISEISFSALHCGGEETGYVRMPFFRSLATCTALTGAGCMDAISLTMSDLMSLRFWLEVLNLAWGDYILFQPEKVSFFMRLKWLGHTFESMVVPNLIKIPGVLPMMLVYLILFMAWHQMIYSDASCAQSRFLFVVAIWLSVAVVGASFYTFLPGCGLISMSPLIRRLHQLTMYFYRGNHPPHMVYVTDGGVKDCTSCLQLLARRQERILLVLAAADPKDELGVLKTAMQVARTLKICTFYNPEDPRQDLDVLFADYRDDVDVPFLHIGVSYCWAEPDGGPTTGHLFVVKNRLPTRCIGAPVQPLLEEEEVRQGKGFVAEERGDGWAGRTTDSLGPFGCCDCCHANGLNCGPKFPHGTFTGYLYLSPQWCNGLMRLGYEASAAAVARVGAREALAEPWEAVVREAPEGL